MSTSRDFRINVATVQAVMENDSESEESEEETEENDTTTADQEMEEVYTQLLYDLFLAFRLAEIQHYRKNKMLHCPACDPQDEHNL